jgi:hypothetical protein
VLIHGPLALCWYPSSEVWTAPWRSYTVSRWGYHVVSHHNERPPLNWVRCVFEAWSSSECYTIQRFSPYLTGNALRLHNKAQPVNAVQENNHCLLWEPYGTQIHCVGRMQWLLMLKYVVHTSMVTTVTYRVKIGKVFCETVCETKGFLTMTELLTARLSLELLQWRHLLLTKQPTVTCRVSAAFGVR